MDKIYRVSVVQDIGTVEFEFDLMTNAMMFASTCMESGNRETRIHIWKDDKEDE